MLPFCVFATWCRQTTHFFIVRGWEDKNERFGFSECFLDGNFKCLTSLHTCSDFEAIRCIFNFNPLALQQAFHTSQQTVREFNHYIIVMVNCLWNSRMFHTNNLGLKIDEELLLRSKVPQWGARFSFIHHPAFMSFAIDFHQRVGDRLLCCTHTHTHTRSLIKVQLLLIIRLRAVRGVFTVESGHKSRRQMWY